MEQRARRVVFIAGMFPLPGLGLLSAAMLIMVAQLRGPREAIVDGVLAMLLLAAIALLVGMDLPVLAVTAGLSWLVWVGLGALQGWSGSLQLTVQVAVVVALAMLIAMLLMFDNATAYWISVLETLYKDLAEQGVKIETDVRAQAGLMSGVVVAGSLTGSLLALCLGSSWASTLAGGDFGAQFRQLRLGLVIGVLAVVTGLAEWLGLSTSGALLVFGAAFTFQGVAVLAWWADALAWPRSWWIGLCILLILVPNLLIIGLVLLSAIGFIDNWYNLRRKTA
jgi:low affinity Fe/Cu permease